MLSGVILLCNGQYLRFPKDYWNIEQSFRNLNPANPRSQDYMRRAQQIEDLFILRQMFNPPRSQNTNQFQPHLKEKPSFKTVDNKVWLG